MPSAPRICNIVLIDCVVSSPLRDSRTIKLNLAGDVRIFLCHSCHIHFEQICLRNLPTLPTTMPYPMNAVEIVLLGARN